jgi:hypothetical protein
MAQRVSADEARPADYQDAHNHSVRISDSITEKYYVPILDFKVS